MEKGLAQNEHLEGWHRLKISRLHEQLTILTNVNNGQAIPT